MPDYAEQLARVREFARTGVCTVGSARTNVLPAELVRAVLARLDLLEGERALIFKGGQDAVIAVAKSYNDAQKLLDRAYDLIDQIDCLPLPETYQDFIREAQKWQADARAGKT